MLSIDLPEVIAELEAEYLRYEAALARNDVAVLDGLFWNDAATVRYGLGENLHGHDEIAAFRASVRKTDGKPKNRLRTVVTTYGTDMGTVNTLFARDTMPGKVGRQSQTWLRTVDGWRIVAAHVSIIDSPVANAMPVAANHAPFDAGRYVDGVSQAIGLPIPAESRAAVTTNLAQVAVMADLVMSFPVADDIEPAPVFQL